MGRDIAGWGCLAIGLALVALHIYTTLRPPSPAVQVTEGVQAIAEKLAEKAPSLAGALAFVFLGLVVLGYLDVSIAAGTSTE